MSIADVAGRLFRSPNRLDMPIGDLMHLLSCERRRLAIEYAVDTDDSFALRDLADWVAKQEFEAPETSDRQAVYITVYQNHLEKLIEAGAIRRAGHNRYARGSNAQQLLDVIERVGEVLEG